MIVITPFNTFIHNGQMYIRVDNKHRASIPVDVYVDGVLSTSFTVDLEVQYFTLSLSAAPGEHTVEFRYAAGGTIDMFRVLVGTGVSVAVAPAARGSGMMLTVFNSHLYWFLNDQGPAVVAPQGQDACIELAAPTGVYAQCGVFSSPTTVTPMYAYPVRIELRLTYSATPSFSVALPGMLGYTVRVEGNDVVLEAYKYDEYHVAFVVIAALVVAGIIAVTALLTSISMTVSAINRSAIVSRYTSLLDSYRAELDACGGDPQCINAVHAKYQPQLTVVRDVLVQPQQQQVPTWLLAAVAIAVVLALAR